MRSRSVGDTQLLRRFDKLREDIPGVPRKEHALLTKFMICVIK